MKQSLFDILYEEMEHGVDSGCLTSLRLNETEYGPSLSYFSSMWRNGYEVMEHSVEARCLTSPWYKK